MTEVVNFEKINKDWKWVKEIGSDPPAYSPYNEDTGDIMLGLVVLNTPPGDVVGEFRFNEDYRPWENDEPYAQVNLYH